MRSRVNKGRAARAFRKATTRTKGINMAPPPMRGGIRL